MNTRLKFTGIEINPTSDEWNVMQDSNREAIFSMTKGMAGTGIDYIISGVDAVINTGVDATVSDGFVVINDEVLKVDAQVVPETEATDIYVFQKQTTMGASPDWDRFFRDGSMHNVLQVDRAVVVNVAAAGGDLLINGPTLPEVITPTLTVADGVYPGILSVAKYNQFDVAEQNVQSDWAEINTGVDSYINNKPFEITTAAPQSFVIPSEIIVTHPALDVISIEGVLICKIANNGFIIGDRVPVVTALDIATPGTDFINTNVEWWTDTATTSKIRVRTSGWRGFNKSTGVLFTVLDSDWDIQITTTVV